MSHKKFGPDRFSRFDVYWIQTNRQTDKPNLYIEEGWMPLLVLLGFVLTKKTEIYLESEFTNWKKACHEGNILLPTVAHREQKEKGKLWLLSINMCLSMSRGLLRY